jgi:kynurenine formamidase
MCEPSPQKIAGWKGWTDLPAPRITQAAGGWIDLSHRITETLSRIPFFPQPRIRQITKIPEHRANVTEVHMVVHHGTHVDAPRHFIVDGPTMDEVPLERLYGPGVIWRLDLPPRGMIEIAHLERATPRLQPGDIVLIDTGSAARINTDGYEEHPSLSGEAAEWLLEHGAKLVGIDASSPDMAPHYRPADYAMPVHNTLLSHGVLIAEHMTNLTPLAGRRVEVMFLALNIAGSDGAPARVVARPIE